MYTIALHDFGLFVRLVGSITPDEMQDLIAEIVTMLEDAGGPVCILFDRQHLDHLSLGATTAFMQEEFFEQVEEGSFVAFVIDSRHLPLQIPLQYYPPQVRDRIHVFDHRADSRALERAVGWLKVVSSKRS